MPSKVCATTSRAISLSPHPGSSISIASASPNSSMPRAAEKVVMMADAARYTASELLAVMSARLLQDGQVVFAGVGIPLLAASLAQRLHAPGLTILFEGGVIGAFIDPGKLTPSNT